MEAEPKDLMVLGAIKGGTKKFDKIKKQTKIEPEEINNILERLEKRGLIRVEEKKGFFGPKIEIFVTEKGDVELKERVHELEENWNQMARLYKSGNKQKLQQYMDDNRTFLPTMMFFGIIDLMMFSAMFSLLGAQMTDYMPTDQVPEGGEGGDFAGDGMDDGSFDVDIGF